MKKTFATRLSLAICAALSTSAFAASFDVSEIDTKLGACADFNAFVNAKWVAANPIPADRTRWGAFDAAREELADAARDRRSRREGRERESRFDRAEDRLVLPLRHG
jgi:putative endopeptidase